MTEPTTTAAKVNSLLAHARRYGPEDIAETAVEMGMGEDYLTRLIEGLDAQAVEHAKKAKFGGAYKKPRRTARYRARRLLGIEETADASE